jgi:hypothetical protein
MPGFEVQGEEIGVILELATLNEDLLAVGLNASDRVELILENLSGLGKVEIEFVAGTGMFYDD